MSDFRPSAPALFRRHVTMQGHQRLTVTEAFAVLNAIRRYLTEEAHDRRERAALRRAAAQLSKAWMRDRTRECGTLAPDALQERLDGREP